MPERYAFGDLQETETAAQTSALDLFSGEPIECRIRERRPCQAKSTSAIQGTGPFDIYIPAEKKSYIDPGSIRVNTSFKIKEISPAKELSNITDGVYPIYFFSKCIFKDIEVELESQKISLNASNTYPVRSYIKTILSYGEDAANGHLECSY